MTILRSIAVLGMALMVAPSVPALAGEALAPGYVSSEPEDGAMVDEAPDEVTVTFDEPLDPSSELAVTDECDRVIDDGNVAVQATQMTVGIAVKPSGDYTVTWLAKGIAGATGQATGEFSFMVHSGPACDDTGPDHDGHGNGAGDGKDVSDDEEQQHSGHGGGGEDDMEGHDGDGGSVDHSSMGSSSMDHSSMASGSTHDHSSMKHGDPNRHDQGRDGSSTRHGTKHGAGRGDATVRGRAIAAPDRGAPTAPDGQAALTALGLCLALGAVGGWFLRVSGSR